uniref:Uncharacterized protein n=1 Tax=Glossina brevipalpis TaxID=37001 RepID=A0A1A9WAY1_9MUSC
MFRLQKLMMAEYDDIYEPALKIIFGCDDFDSTDLDTFLYQDTDRSRYQDVSIAFLEYLAFTYIDDKTYESYSHMSGSPTFSSIDILVEEEICQILIHPERKDMKTYEIKM